MTAIIFIIALLAARFHLLLLGWYVWPGYTIYVVAFAVVLAFAVMVALSSRDRRSTAAGVVLIINFAATHWGWASENILVNQAIIDGVTMAYFVFAGGTRWELGIAAIYGLSALAAGAASIDLIPGLGERPPVFLAWSYADITSLCGHAAAITLGLGAGDWGKRVRSGARRKPAFLRGAPSLVALAVGWRERAFPH